MLAKTIEIVTQDVTRLFQLNSDELFELKLDYGLKYIKDRYPSDIRWGEPEIAQALKKSELFWNWWIDLWAHRDRLLMNKCERKIYAQHNGECEYGVNYTFLLNGYMGQQRMQETRVLAPDDLWDFYQDYHYWRKVTLYPSEVLIGACIKATSPALWEREQVSLTIKQ